MNLYVIDADGKIKQNNTSNGSTGSGFGTVWFPDAPPAVAGGLDDEFTDSSFDNVLWSEFDPNGTMTVSESGAGLILDQSSQSSDSIAGIYQSISNSDFTVWTKLSTFRNLSDYSSVGLALYDDAANSSTGMYTFSLQGGSGSEIRLDRYSTHDSYDYNEITISDAVINNTLYLRIRCESGYYYFDWSSDGIGWTLIHDVSLGTTPLHVGPYINNANSGVNIRALFSFFRSTNSNVGLTGVTSGRRISLYE